MFRSLTEYLTIDPRHAVKVLVDLSTGEYTTVTFSDWYANVSPLNLVDPVPSIIVDQFDKARNSFALSWFAFDLTMVAELQAYLALEMALCSRMEINPAAKGALRLKQLLKTALRGGILSKGDFNKAHPNGETPEMLIEMIVRQRNGLSHGSEFLFGQYSEMSLEICSHLIQAAFGH
jgi:hypothetical protein